MSDFSADSYTERLNLADLVARIERQQAETRKFVAERDKLLAEAGKLNRDRFFAPFAIACATFTAIAALAPSIIRALGG